MTMLHKQIADWATKYDTGSSSIAVARAALNLDPKDDFGRICYPHDPADFGRCVRLIEQCPGARIGVTRLARIHPRWAYINKHWRKMKRIYREEIPNGRCPKLYDMMQSSHRIHTT